MSNNPVIIIDENGKQRRTGSGGVVRQIIEWAVFAVIMALAYWFVLPPLNWRSGDFWGFVLFALVVRFVISALSSVKRMLQGVVELEKNKHKAKNDIKSGFKGLGKLSKILLAIAAVILVFMLIASVIGAELFNASAYSKLIEHKDGDFSADVAEISMNSIPVVDRDTATRLGQRKLGEMSDLVSQFEVDDSYYIQINYNGVPYRVTPLRYGDFFKWINNQSEGIPAYVTVNMVTQETELIRLEQGIKYSNGEYFMRDLYRHLRFKYPTAIFDNISFELDDDGTPYYIASVVDYQIGVWSGRDIAGAVMCNAVTGECNYYEIGDIPSWVDQVYDAEMLFEQLAYNGKYQSGYFNSIFGQKGVMAPTDGYNYLALGDDVYLYTGITSVASDESNVGFVLINLRTKESRYYVCPGAEEYSAMESAEGVVQDLGYKSTFPILLNINDRPTYFVSLKDSAGLVKMYAFIDVQHYQVVATGNTIREAKENYTKRLAEDIGSFGNGSPEPEPESKTAVGVISQLESAVLESKTHYYIMLDGDERVYIVAVDLNNKLPFAKTGDTVTVTYYEKNDKINVTDVEIQ